MNSSGIRSVIIKASDGAGLGDRLLALASGLAYANLTNRRIFVDWRDGLYARKGMCAFCEVFNLVNIEELSEIPLEGSAAPETWQNHLGLSFSDLVTLRSEYEGWNRERAHRLYSVDQGNMNYREDHVVIWDYEQFDKMIPALDKFYPNFDWSNHDLGRGFILRNHLRIKPELKSQINAWFNLHSSPIIGLNIRATYEGRDRFVPIENFIPVIKGILRKFPEASIFPATDNIEILQSLESEFSNVCSIPKNYPKPWESLHIGPETNEQRLKGLKEAVVDLFTLCQSDFILYSPASSFGRAAALMSGLPISNLREVWPDSSGAESGIRSHLRCFRNSLKKRIYLKQWLSNLSYPVKNFSTNHWAI